MGMIQMCGKKYFLENIDPYNRLSGIWITMKDRIREE